MKKYIVTLSKDERDTLREITFKGTHKSQKILNAQILSKSPKILSPSS